MKMNEGSKMTTRTDRCDGYERERGKEKRDGGGELKA
jgi:hypothetical protein